MKAPAYSATGTKLPDITLDGKLFGTTVNPQLLAQAYQIYLGNQRTNNARTLTRGLVSGGGKKPYRQKGTGRARSGSIRNPIWRGGGITFGPTGIENYTRTMPRTMARSAMTQALSDKAAANQIIVIEKFASTDGKVKPMIALIDKLQVEGTIYVIVDETNDLTLRATRNIAGVNVVTANDINIFEVLNADMLIIQKKALDVLKKRLGSTKQKVGAKS